MHKVVFWKDRSSLGREEVEARTSLVRASQSQAPQERTSTGEVPIDKSQWVPGTF